MNPVDMRHQVNFRLKNNFQKIDHFEERAIKDVFHVNDDHSGLHSAPNEQIFEHITHDFLDNSSQQMGPIFHDFDEFFGVDDDNRPEGAVHAVEVQRTALFQHGFDLVVFGGEVGVLICVDVVLGGCWVLFCVYSRQLDEVGFDGLKYQFGVEFADVDES